MTQSFFQGFDTHKQTASLLYDKPMDEVTHEERQSAKSVSFGLIYGKSTNSLADDLGVSVDEAQQIVDKYMSNKPKVRDFINSTKEFAEENGYVETLWGHRRKLNDIHSKDSTARGKAERQTVNTVIQGSGAFLTNTSCIMINSWLEQTHKKSKLIATVHDSVVLDVHPDELHEVAIAVKYIMENLPIPWLQIEWNGKQTQYPIACELEVGATYNDTYEYDEEEFNSFKTVHGFTDYNILKSYFIDSHDTKDEDGNPVMDEATMKAGVAKVESEKNEFQKY